MASDPASADLAGYLDRVRERLRGAGFDLLPSPDGVEIRAHRYGFQATRFGMVDTFVTVGRQTAPVDERAVADFSARWFATDVQEKKGPPRGLFGQVVSHPVLLVDRTDDATRSYVRGYAPKHWSSLEFPALVDMGSGELFCCEHTPVWGAAYYRKSRDEIRALAAP
jgi:hypothetical protein